VILYDLTNTYLPVRSTQTGFEGSKRGSKIAQPTFVPYDIAGLILIMIYSKIKRYRITDEASKKIDVKINPWTIMINNSSFRPVGLIKC